MNYSENDQPEEAAAISPLAAAFQPIHRLLETITKTPAISGIIQGKPGIGKTYSVIHYLHQHDIPFQHISGYTTPLEFYNLLYTHNHKLLVLDDFNGILDDHAGLSILKSALWTSGGKRILHYHSNTSKRHAPKEYEYNGKIVFCLNEIPDMDASAVTSRTLTLKVHFTLETALNILPELAAAVEYSGMISQTERQQVAEYLKKKWRSIDDVDFRQVEKTFWLLEHARQYGGNWRQDAEDYITLRQSLSQDLTLKKHS